MTEENKYYYYKIRILFGVLLKERLFSLFNPKRATTVTRWLYLSVACCFIQTKSTTYVRLTECPSSQAESSQVVCASLVRTAFHLYSTSSSHLYSRSSQAKCFSLSLFHVKQVWVVVFPFETNLSIPSFSSSPSFCLHLVELDTHRAICIEAF